MPVFPDLVIAFEEKTPYSTLHIRAATREQVSAFREIFERLSKTPIGQQVIDGDFAVLESPLEKLVLEADDEESWLDARTNVHAGTISVHWTCTAQDWLTAVATLDSLTGGQEKRYLPPDDARYPIEVEFNFGEHLNS